MIYITQGDSQGIGLEVLLKSLIDDRLSIWNDFQLICNKETLEKNLENLKISYCINKNQVYFNNNQLSFLDIHKESQTLSSLEKSLELINARDILITLPASKNQFQKNGIHYAGHTEFFRRHYQKDFTMFFWAQNFIMYLLTDHIPLKDVTENIDKNIILDKSEMALNFLDKINWPINKLIFSGINPHAGEDGLLGTEEKVFDHVLKNLSKTYPQIDFEGPYSGDTLHMKRSYNHLLAYCFHDQGLAAFKALNGFKGANITCGLPFIRISVDHGTAPDIYGKNMADYEGMLFCLELATKFHLQVRDGN